MCLCLCSCKSSDYKKAVALYESGEYRQAIVLFRSLGDYEDSVQMIEACELAILEEAYNGAIALMEAGSYEDAMDAFEDLEDYKDSAQKIAECELAILEGRYHDAVALMEAEKYAEAMAAFEALDGFKDSKELAAQAELGAKYASAEARQNQGRTAEAAIAFGKIADYKDARARSKALWAEITVSNSHIDTGYANVGLRSDGTVIATGDNRFGQCDVENWTDIKLPN